MGTPDRTKKREVPLFYQVNAATIYNIAHDANLSEPERKDLIGRMLVMMACSTVVERDAAEG